MTFNNHPPTVTSTPPSPTPLPTSPAWSTRMSFLFGLCALLGVLLLIFSEVGLAQGFKPGGAAIGNPLNDPYGDDKDFEEFDDDLNNGGALPQRPARTTQPQPQAPVYNDNNAGGSNNAGAGTGGNNNISLGGNNLDDKPGAEIHKSKKGYELSGPGTEKGIKTKNEIPFLVVDNESGDGNPANKELITDFNFPNADIMDLAKTMGRLTGKNFILDKEVKGGTVSIISNSPVTVSDAWRAFLTSLDMNSLALVPTGKYLRIMRQNDAKGKNVRLYSNSRAPNTDALVTKIFKIKYISAKELENVIRTYANMSARIYGFEQTNTLIITDTGSNIDKIAKMITFLDVEGFDAGIEVVQVKYASAVELQKLIDTLLPGTQTNNRPGFPGGGGFGGAGGGGGGRNSFQARKTKEGGLVNTIIADERTNTLIVHANPKGAEQVRELVARLDRKMPAALGGGKVHVVYLQFADSEEMAKTLNNFSQNAKSNTGNAGFGFPGGGGGLGINPNENALFEGQIKVSADKSTNSLVITASPSDYATIQRVINKLDIPRDQIFVEVLIMEMGMDRGSAYAADVIHGKSGTSVSPTTDLIDMIKDPTKVSTGMLLQYRDSNTTTVTVPGAAGAAASTFQIPNLAALIKAVQTSSNSQVIASPQLMTMDNVEATFESTDQIPTLDATSGIGGTVTNKVQFIDVPLSIKIKPQLNKISNFIKMDIKAKISDVTTKNVPNALTNISPAKLTRNAETSVMVNDGDTVVLGGLIRDKQTETITKVPLLGDIPILGWLFKARNADISKTNLLLFITPRIMRQPENVRMVLDKKLKERDNFVETAMGGEDRQRDTRNNMIRSLPDVKTIKNYNTRSFLNQDDDDSLEDSKKSAKNDATSKPAPEKTAPGNDTKDTLTLPQLDPVPPAVAPSPSNAVPPPPPPPTAPNPAPANPPDPNDPFAPITPGGKTP